MREGSQPADAIPLTEHEIIEKLRAWIPVDGEEWTYLWRLVVLPGSRVDNHLHIGWTACYYEEVGDGGCVILNGERMYPKNGDVILFPPKAAHEVEENTGTVPRRSFALTFNEGDNRQVIKDVIR